MSGELIDLSHTIYHGLETYPGLPTPSIADHLSRVDSRQLYAPGTEFHIARIEMVANTGTYLDVPSHRYADGRDLSEIPLGAVADLRGVRIDLRSNPSRRIEKSDLGRSEVEGRAVLLCTGWSQLWGTQEYRQGHPFLTDAAAQFLVEQGAALVGIDSLNIDDTGDPRRPAHSRLLGNEVPIVEHLTNLELLPASGFRFFSVPPKIRGMGSFPTRAFAILQGD